MSFVQADILAHYLIGDVQHNSTNWVSYGEYFNPPPSPPNYKASFWLNFDGSIGPANIEYHASYNNSFGTATVNFPSGHTYSKAYIDLNLYPYIPVNAILPEFTTDAGGWQTWSNKNITKNPSTNSANSFFSVTPNEGYSMSLASLSFQWGVVIGPGTDGKLDSDITLGYSIYTRTNGGSWFEHTELRNNAAATLNAGIDAEEAYVFNEEVIDLSSLGIITDETDIMIAFLNDYNGDLDGHLIARNLVVRGNTFVIPEPSSAMLIGSILILPLTRRKRNI